MKKNHQKKAQGRSKKQPPEPPKEKPEPRQPKPPEQPKLLAGKFQEETEAKITALFEKILAQDKFQEETNAKITALANAVGSLNEEFTKFIDTLKAQVAPAQPAGTQPDGGNAKPIPGLDILAPKEQPQQTTEPSKQDRLMQWMEIITKLTQAAGSGGGGAQADANAMPNSLTQLINSLKVMGELRSTFLKELKEMIGFSKSIETTVKSPPARPGGPAHLPEE